ncbi:MAG: TPM domain-containing protein [Rhodoferax sp.]
MWTRLLSILRHRWLADDAALRAFAPDAQARLAQRVRAGELHHRGQVRVHIEGALPTSYLWRQQPMAQSVRQRALSLFGKLRVWDTEENNGVLIYLLLAERRLEIVADRGIHRKVAPDTWQGLSEAMRAAFRAGAYEQGLTAAIDAVHALLTEHYPRAPAQPGVNELPDGPTLS